MQQAYRLSHLLGTVHLPAAAAVAVGPTAEQRDSKAPDSTLLLLLLLHIAWHKLSQLLLLPLMLGRMLAMLWGCGLCDDPG
jgi:hypothetical protein